jgi:hypothetical protein
VARAAMTGLATALAATPSHEFLRFCRSSGVPVDGGLWELREFFPSCSRSWATCFSNAAMRRSCSAMRAACSALIASFLASSASSSAIRSSRQSRCSTHRMIESRPDGKHFRIYGAKWMNDVNYCCT